MGAVRLILLILHVGGMAVLMGGFVLQLMAGTRQIVPAIFHGAGLQLVTGLLLVGVNEADDRDLNHTKIAVKLGIALAVVGLAHANRAKVPVLPAIFYGAFALAATNVVLAYSWN